MQYKQIIYSVRYCKICTINNGMIDRLHDTMLLLCTTLFAKKKNVHIMRKEVETMAYNKEVQSRYRKKIAQFKAEYSLSEEDKREALRIRAYLAGTGQSANSYIKALIKSDLDNKDIPYPNNTDNTDQK